MRTLNLSEDETIWNAFVARLREGFFLQAFFSWKLGLFLGGKIVSIGTALGESLPQNPIPSPVRGNASFTHLAHPPPELARAQVHNALHLVPIDHHDRALVEDIELEVLSVLIRPGLQLARNLGPMGSEHHGRKSARRRS